MRTPIFLLGVPIVILICGLLVLGILWMPVGQENSLLALLRTSSDRFVCCAEKWQTGS